VAGAARHQRQRQLTAKHLHLRVCRTYVHMYMWT
jgi:hypothetical protein